MVQEPSRQGDFGTRACIRHSGEHVRMPRISEFYGVVIAMYYREHGVRISTRHTLAIRSWYRSKPERFSPAPRPPRALRLVEEWAGLHREELRVNWDRARADSPLERIDPLP